MGSGPNPEAVGRRRTALGAHTKGARRRYSWFRTASGQEELAAYVLLSPYLLMFVAFLVFPSAYGFYLSFTDFRLGRQTVEWIGLENYRYLVTDPLFHEVLKNTAVFVVASTALLVVVPLLLAVCLNRQFPLRNFLRAAYFVPYTLSVSVISITWWWLLDPNFGPLNYYLETWGFNPPPWLSHPDWAMTGVVIATVWWTSGFNLVLFLAGLQNIPAHLYEAAMLDGAGVIRRFWSITLPLLRPTMLLVLVLQTIASFQVFGQVYIMTAGGPAGSTRTVIQYLYEAAFVGQRMAEGAAAAWILFLIILIFSAIQFKFLSGHTEY